MNKETAWFLGWIATDGHIYPDRSRIQLRVATQDKDVLEKMKTHFGVISKILLEPNNGMVDSAVRLNFDGHKSLYDDCRTIKKEVPEIPAEYVRYFLRGLFEGDGSLYQEKPKKATHHRQNVIEFTNGLKPLVEYVRDNLCHLLGLPYKEIKIDTKARHIEKYGKAYEPCWRIYWVGRRANLIAWYLWGGAEENLSLDRKCQLYRDHVIRNHESSRFYELLQALDATIIEDKIHLNIMANYSLEWAQRIQWVTGLNLTPIIINQHSLKGKMIRYYGLHIPKVLKQNSYSHIWDNG